MYGLIDISGAYCAMEKVFDPSIRQKPTVVLSNNDASIIALCNIAKRLGIPKFEPYFKVKHLLEKHGVVIRSSNYTLYAQLSENLMELISTFCDETYVYSIDESFLKFKNYEGIIGNWYEYGHKMRRTIWRHCRLPVGVGLGPTLTLAKAASHGSRKIPGADGVAVIDDDASRKFILEQMKVNDVWQIGKKLSVKLQLMNINTGWDLANQSPKGMRKLFGVTMERTINELNGISSLAWDDVPAPKKQIFSTRSFGQRVNNLHDLRQALVGHGTSVGRKIVQQQSLVKSLYAFAASSPFDERYIKKGLIFDFPSPTDNVMRISAAISTLAQQLYQNNVDYYRCGVGAINIHSKKYRQSDLFEVADNPAIMNCYTQINTRFGKDTLQLASAPRQEKWAMRRAYLSPQYSTRWADIPKIEC